MFKSRATNASLLALTVSVYLCLLATANAQTLAQQSSAVATVQAPVTIGARMSPATVETEDLAAEAALQSTKLSSQAEKIDAQAPISRETYCALLSKYLSLS